ncbi:efflux RND transporter periplasmic adaptor subunit [Planctomycetota bacterium]
MKASVKIAAVIAAVVFVLLIGIAIGRRGREPVPGGAAAETEKKVKFWTCSMDPQIKQPDPGLCPLCAMDLIPVYDSGGEEGTGPRTLVMSKAAAALAEVETASVERKFVEARVQLAGKIDYDETRLKHITARFPGRLDRLYVNYTGVSVRKGDHLINIYSPELLSAQEELIQARKTHEKAKGSDSEYARRSAETTLNAVREKLRLWELTDEQIASIEKSGKASDHVTVYSPVSGVVIRKAVNEGSYVGTGTRIYTIVDLSRVWVLLDAYESDLEWIRYGQNVEFSTEAYPGKPFRGTITFVPPVMDEKTRTVKVRVVAENSDGKLKPGMFVRATVRPKVAAGGKVMDPRLAGKWISPMHPEVIKDKPGSCDVCGMDLVKAEELGYAVAGENNAPLVIPASAPLLTGKRAVVYVKVEGSEKLAFEGREIVLGPRAGDYYVVRKGLVEGETVVARGAFKIDSALQIEAKTSMMSPAGGGGAASHHGHGSGSKDEAVPATGGKKEQGHGSGHK